MSVKMKISELGLSSSPTNTLLYRLRHMHHMRQWGMAFHIAPASYFPNLSDQHNNKSTTPLGITQVIPNKTKINDHSSWATVQWRSIAMSLAHAAPIYTDDPSLSEVVNCENPLQGRCPSKKSHSGRHLEKRI